jgi:hypothetical protein
VAVNTRLWDAVRSTVTVPSVTGTLDSSVIPLAPFTGGARTLQVVTVL